jgi:signal transduction histidine kinase
MFPLLRYFSIASAAALLGATVLIVMLYRHTVLEHVAEHGEVSNVAMAQSLWQDVRPVLGPYLRSTATSGDEEPAAGPMTARLRRVVGERIQGRTVFKVKIINLKGVVVFSTQESQIGTDYSRAPGVISALSGRAVSELTRRDHISALGHPVSDAAVISTYVPIFGKSGDVEAVVEVYDNVTALTYYLKRSFIGAGFAIFGLFGLVYLFLFMIVWRAAKVMSEQHRQILDNQAALRDVNEELELRVAERSLQLRETQEDLHRKQRLATLGQLIGSVGHDLRNPLGVMRNSLAAIAAASEQANSNLKRPIERCERSIRRCEGIIDDLLDHTRVRELTLAPTALDPWLESILDEQTLPDGIVLRRDLAAAGIEIPLDADRFRRVIANLFDNACQAMVEVGERPDGESEHCLSVATRVLGEEVEISFSDTGSGIPPEAMARIFEPLFTTKASGIGLGLPMVKQIVEQHGGQIDIGCPVQRGTQARLCLPLRKAREAAA